MKFLLAAQVGCLGKSKRRKRKPTHQSVPLFKVRNHVKIEASLLRVLLPDLVESVFFRLHRVGQPSQSRECGSLHHINRNQRPNTSGSLVSSRFPRLQRNRRRNVFPSSTGSVKMKSAVEPCCRTSPLTRVSIVRPASQVQFRIDNRPHRAKSVEALWPASTARLSSADRAPSHRWPACSHECRHSSPHPGLNLRARLPMITASSPSKSTLLRNPRHSNHASRRQQR